MIPPASESTAQLRWGVYALLIALAVGNMAGRLMAVNSVNRAELELHLINRELRPVERDLRAQNLSEDELQKQLAEARKEIAKKVRLQRPFLSANDRSRWLAVRGLVEQGTFAIDGLLDRHVWNTIDMVQHQGPDGEPHLYSSKPPLLITLVAGEYWVLNKLTGMTLGSEPYLLGRLMLVTINILPLVLMFTIVAKLAERWGTTDWGRIYVVAAATFGTLLTTFAVVLNNHVIAAVSVAVALYAWMRIRCDGQTGLRYFALAGLAAAFAAANELPALALLVGMGVELVRGNRKAWLAAFLPAAAIVVVAFFATNYAAHQSLRPPYMHRSETDPQDNWYAYTYTLDGVERESYWLNRQGIDRGEPSKLTYTWHALVGHHGILSLTPVWLLSLAGALIWLRQGSARQAELAWAIIGLTLVCLVFYLGMRPQGDRNYGGMTSGFRWMFWFAPLWLAMLLPAADWTAGTVARKAVATTLLAMSVFSASYPTWNPWIQPWIYRWLEYCGWQGF